MGDSMDNFPKQPAAEMQRRPETVDALFTATMIGIKDTMPKNVSSLVGDGGQNWSGSYEKVKDQLEKQSTTGDTKAAAIAKVMMEQLDKLNSMPAAERSTYLRNLSSADQKLAGLNNNQDDVKANLMYSKGEAISKQKDSVNLADGINVAALQYETSSVKDAIAHNSDSKVTPLLNEELNQTRAAMAAPFTERVRLAALQLKNGSEVQAEETLTQALKAPVPAEAWSLQSLKLLRDDVTAQRDELHAENNLLPLFNQTLAKLSVITGRQDITRSDFSAPCLKDPQFGALSKFLSSNYDSLTKGHNMFQYNQGITRSDIEKFVNERNRRLNDFVN